jgi:hypothetical protein
METPKLPSIPNNQLPTLQELFEDSIEVAAKSEGLNAILNANPPSTWVKIHPQIAGWQYLPIEKVEYLLTKIFKNWSVEVLKTGMLMNAVECTVRVHYYNPATDKMEFVDGVGACELQTKKESGALKMDMSNVNRGAVSMALPIAKTFAIKDATGHLGKIFGRDLNRKDTIPFQADQVIIDRVEKRKQLLNDKKNV